MNNLQEKQTAIPTTMREIKFKRVFINRNTGEYHFHIWGNIDFRGESVFDFSSFASPGTNSHSSPIIDLQYTGVKDRNGKEIYEGDILDFIFDGVVFVDNRYYVVFDKGYFGIKKPNFNPLVSDCENIVVRGNIYE